MITQFNEELVREVALAVRNTDEQPPASYYKRVAQATISVIAPHYEKQIAELKEQTEWKDINDIADSDGCVLGWFPRAERVGFLSKNYMNNGFMEQMLVCDLKENLDKTEATHFMNLPKPPTQEEE